MTFAQQYQRDIDRERELLAGLLDTRTSREYIRARRAAALKRYLAWLAVAVFVTLLGIALGVLAGAVNSPLFTALLPIAVLAGIWGGYHLLTRH